jgi:Cellulose biosynthesis protein BcsS
VSALRVVSAMAAAVAGMLLCATVGRAQVALPNSPTFLLFGGTDLWRYGAFLYGGTLWSPAGLNADGFTLKLLVNGGRYAYNSGALNGQVDGTMLSGAALPGWRFVRGGLTVSLFAGPVVQDYRLSPFDPGSRLHGLYAGGQFATDVWYQPSATIMAALNGSVASIGPTGHVRGALGYRVFDALFVGPEAAMLWCADFNQIELGAHLTGLHVEAMEWSAGAGWSMDSDRRSGPYLRIGVSTRY